MLTLPEANPMVPLEGIHLEGIHLEGIHLEGLLPMALTPPLSLAHAVLVAEKAVVPIFPLVPTTPSPHMDSQLK